MPPWFSLEECLVLLVLLMLVCLIPLLLEFLFIDLPLANAWDVITLLGVVLCYYLKLRVIA